jgi:predicted permease
MGTLLADVRYALRQFVKRPLFTLVVVVTLALGIGGNAAIFTVADQVLLEPLPYHDPDRLVRIYSQFPGLGFDRFWISAPEYLELAEWNKAFSAVGGWTLGQANVSGGERPVRVDEGLVTASFFETLGVPAERGRWITAEEDRPGGPQVEVISHEFWQRVLGGDPEAVGKVIEVDGISRTIVGVMPEGFDIEDAGIEVWTPLGIDPASPGNRGGHFLEVIGRRADGVSFEQARQDIGALLDRWEATFADDQHRPNRENHQMVAHPLHLEVVGSARTPLLLLLGAVGFVLLIACANVANLLLARAESRKREIAVRSSLGAARGRLVRQFLTESLVLALAGAAVGLGVAWGGLKLALAANPDAIPRAAEIRLDSAAVGYAALIAIATGLLFGIAPALRARPANLAITLKEGGRAMGGVSGNAMRRSLVIAEVALATMLLLGAGLLLRSFQSLQRVDPGFTAGGVLSFQVSLPSANYPDTVAVRAFYERLAGGLGALPGVKSAAGMSGLPPTRDINANDTEFEGVETGQDLPANVDYYQIVTPDLFATLEIPIVEGRGFRPTDSPESPPVVVVNQALAKRFYPGESVVGKRIRRGWFGDEEPWFTVVGVSADVKQAGLDQPAGTELYFLHGQWASLSQLTPSRTLNFELRTAGDPLALVPAVRRVVQGLDPTLPLADVRPLERAVAESLARPRFMTLLVTAFAAIALLLAAVGTYGVLAYAVEQRRHEMGLRMALGAQAREVLALVLGQGMRPVLVGLVLGIAGALALNRVLASQLYGIAPTDPLTFVVVPVVLFAVALAACLVPGGVATRVDPAVALRQE